MDSKQFSELSLPEKREIVKNSHYLLTKEDHRDYSIHLYSFDRHFLVEYFDNAKSETTHVKLLGSKELDNLLEDVNLADLRMFL